MKYQVISIFVIALVGCATTSKTKEVTAIKETELHTYCKKRDITSQVSTLEVSLNHCVSTIVQRGEKIASKHPTCQLMYSAFQDLELSVQSYIGGLPATYVDELRTESTCRDEYFYFTTTNSHNVTFAKLTPWLTE